MKAAICVQSSRVETYSDSLAAMISAFPDVQEVVFLFMMEQDDEALLREVEADLHRANKLEAYVQASRRSRSTRRVQMLSRSALRGFRVIDVTGVSKEIMAEILPIALTSGQSICSLAWQDRINRERKYIGRDEHTYYDAMKSPVVQGIYRAQKAVWLMFYILSAIIMSFAALYAAQLFGFDIISDKLVNLLGILVALGGLFLSYTALRLVPPQNQSGE